MTYKPIFPYETRLCRGVDLPVGDRAYIQSRWPALDLANAWFITRANGGLDRRRAWWLTADDVRQWRALSQPRTGSGVPPDRLPRKFVRAAALWQFRHPARGKKPGL
jgi:hypothetical protein